MPSDSLRPQSHIMNPEPLDTNMNIEDLEFICRKNGDVCLVPGCHTEHFLGGNSFVGNLCNKHYEKLPRELDAIQQYLFMCKKIYSPGTLGFLYESR